MAREPGSPSGRERGRALGGRFFRIRIWIYVLALIVIILFRFVPGFRNRLPTFGSPVRPSGNELIVAGLDLAPVLIPRLSAEYRREYPSVDLKIMGGGMRQALEDLVNDRAELAFLNRLPSPAEKRIIAGVVDSVETYPIALGGIAVLSARDGGIDSVTTAGLRAWLRGGTVPDAPRPERFYVPDPNLGLWTVLAEQLGVSEEDTSQVVWLADEIAVMKAVAAQPASLGFGSTLSLPLDELERSGARMVRVRGDTLPEAALPGAGEIGSGDYPLYHYLYVSFLPGVGTAGAGFVTFLYSPRGQRLVEREGFLPARQVARTVQLVRKPIG
jgi:ABC-type phosphate transport system substrate-binding protein